MGNKMLWPALITLLMLFWLIIYIGRALHQPEPLIAASPPNVVIEYVTEYVYLPTRLTMEEKIAKAEAAFEPLPDGAFNPKIWARIHPNSFRVYQSYYLQNRQSQTVRYYRYADFDELDNIRAISGITEDQVVYERYPWETRP